MGTPKILHSDNGKEFVNDIIDNHFSDWPGDTTIVNRRPRNPRCQGLVEKGNASLEKLLGAQLLEAADLANGREMLPWTTWLPTIQCKLIHSISSLFSVLTCFVCYLDQLNTTVHATMKTTAFELVFGQHPRSVIFPGILTKKIQEDVEDILYESDNNDEEVQQYDAGYSNEERQQYDMWCNDEEQQQYGLKYDDEGKQQQYDMDNDERQQQYDMDSDDEGRQQNYDMDNDNEGRQQQHDMDNDDEVRQQKYDVECDDGKRQQYGTNSSNEDCYHQSLATTSKHILMRKKADICYCENAKRMQLKYTKAKRKKIMTFSVGDYVSVHIPRIDCSFTDSHRLPSIVVERLGTKFYLYQLSCSLSVLKQTYGKRDLELFKGMLSITVDGWEDVPFVAISEAALRFNPFHEFHEGFCNCKTHCNTQ